MAEDGAADVKRRRRGRRRRKLIVVGLVAVLLVAGAGTAWALRGPDGPQYRLASVEHTDVKQTVDADGTLAARKTATAAFASAGTVNSLRVGVGDKVSAGQVLATIDGSALENTVTAADNTLAQTKQKLADDEEAQANGTTTTSTTSSTSGAGTSNFSVDAPTASTTTTSARRTATASAVLLAAMKAVPTSSAPSTPTSSSSSAPASSAPSTPRSPQPSSTRPARTSSPTRSARSKTSAGRASSSSSLKAAQSAVVAAQHALDVAVRAQTGYVGLLHSCVALADRQSGASTTDCAAAVVAVDNGQTAVSGALTALDGALAELTAAIARQATTTTGGSRTSGGTGSSNHTSSGTGSSNHTSSGTGTGGSTNNTSGQTVTSEQIAADTKAIDAAQVEVAVAEQNLTTATLRSPIAGTVGAVSISKGATVSASSSSSTITVVGTGTLSIDLSISLADIDLVKVGQTAAVTVDGHSTALPATVSLVGLLNSSSSTGSASTYSVTVQLDHAYASLYDGMGASAAIDVGSAKNVLAVPVSAVHTNGARHTVDVDVNGKSTTKLVTVGVVGDDLVQVKSGLAAGDRVILADLGAAIPSSTAFAGRGTRSGLTGLTGGAGAGGRFGGGAGGR